MATLSWAEGVCEAGTIEQSHRKCGRSRSLKHKHGDK